MVEHHKHVVGDGDIRLGDIKSKHTVQEFYVACQDWLYQYENLDVINFIGAVRQPKLFTTAEHIVVLSHGFNIDEKLASWLTDGIVRQPGTDFFCNEQRVRKYNDKYKEV